MISVFVLKWIIDCLIYNMDNNISISSAAVVVGLMLFVLVVAYDDPMDKVITEDANNQAS